MKILHTADWHLGAFKSPTKDGVNLRFMDTVKCLEEMVRTAKEEKCDYVLVSGDIFHVGLLWSNRCCDEIVTAARFIKELASIAKHVIVMRGTPNHDGIGQFNVLNDMFEPYKNVHIVTEPKILFFEDIKAAVLPGFDAGYFRAKFPNVSKEEENEVFTQELANLVIGMKAQCSQSKTDNRKCILMAHCTVAGADTESGQTMFLSKFEPVIPREALETADYDLAALGHIHRPQEISGLKNCFYSGGINAFNFNDEGQERGFWIHSIDEGITSRFYKTPYREFITLNLNDEDITAINSGYIDLVAENSWRYGECVRDKIVRVLYSCTAENAKAFNSTVLKDTLTADGAFMVFDILPENTEETVNREELESTSDPEVNLRKYLEEKKLSEEKIQELILKARPIISRAEAAGRTGSSAGFFEPVEIEVKNYRNYVYEKFSFEDISFCTINGQNGAGKSSLFMDAIIDCIYEEPREGKLNVNDIPAWLRNSKDVKSGSISFTFRMGEKTYRIVRTREKSGTGKLNISELVDNEWKNRSGTKMTETQKIIRDIVGMDSFTFKSCALIMQDQYGIFLQAKPTERIEVLGNLLGLEIYKEMNKTAAEMVKEFKDKANEADKEININSGAVARLGNADEELERETAKLNSYESLIQSKTAERDKHKLKLAYQQEAAERRKKFLDNINSLKLKKSEAIQSKIIQQKIVESSEILLSEKEEIEKNVDEYNSLTERQEELAQKSALYSAKQTEAESLAKTADNELRRVEELKTLIEAKNTEMKALEPTAEDEIIRDNAKEYENQKHKLEEAYEAEREYRALEQKCLMAESKLQSVKSEMDTELKTLEVSRKSLLKKAELLENVECIDKENAKCGFLKDAISAKKSLEVYPAKLKEIEQCYSDRLAPIENEILACRQVLSAMNYDSGRTAEISRQVQILKPYAVKLEELKDRDRKRIIAASMLDNLKSSLIEAEKRLNECREKLEIVQGERDLYKEAFIDYEEVKRKVFMLKPWLDKEKQIPVAEERKINALTRITELSDKITDLEGEIYDNQIDAQREALNIGEIPELSGIVTNLNTEIKVLMNSAKEIQMKIGAVKQKAEEVESLKNKIAELQILKTESSSEQADYEILENAFSQAGVPHQIIRSIIPKLKSTANTIIAQMTGGNMSVDFKLEKTTRSGKEKASLDIFVEEPGKDLLPYLSKSGGEKVKSSLSVILALSEIKSASAGINLGMLFIDEPPFLDGDGIQAYCDALETIQNRYGGIKIMAITHDPTMKARFPQNLDVVKTENGSKIIC